MIQTKLQERLHTAIKNQDGFEKSIIRVILSEFSRVGKELDDEAAIKELQKVKKNLLETGTPISLLEAEFVEIYLPKQMTQEAIVAELNAIFEEMCYAKSMASMKPFMSAFNNLFPGQDNRIVAQEIKNILKNEE